MRIQTIDADRFPIIPRRQRVRDDVLEGNDPKKRCSRGLIYVGGQLYPIHDAGPDDVEALEAGKNFVLGEPVEAEDVAEWLARCNKDQLAGTKPSDLIAKTFLPGGDRH